MQKERKIPIELINATNRKIYEESRNINIKKLSNEIDQKYKEALKETLENSSDY